MVVRIPQKDKKFSVDNSSFSRGNIYGTFNVMFDADIGKVKLNPPITSTYTSASSGFSNSIAMLVADADDLASSRSSPNLYILTDDGPGFGGVWHTLDGLEQLTVSQTPSTATDATSDMCLYKGAQATYRLYVSDADGLHHCKPTKSKQTWQNVLTTIQYKNNNILVPFTDQNRLYMFQCATANTPYQIFSVQETSDNVFNLTTTGSYTITSGISGITCARAASKRIWFASSLQNTSQKSLIYEWDGVQTTPLNIFTVDTLLIQSIVIFNDLPVAIDGRGRLWFYDGNQFVLRTGINLPLREDDTNNPSVRVHRNGMVADKGKIFINVGGSNVDGSVPNTSERALTGLWCYDPAIGLYHFSSPDNCTRIYQPYALSKYTSENTWAVGSLSTFATLGGGSIYRVSITDTTGGISGSLRTGFITTQFIESQNLTDMFNVIGVKYRDMIYTSASIEVKYRTKKNIECNTTITWTSSTTFTCATADLAGTGTYYNSQVVVGDEVMVQQGVNVGTIAHVTVLAVAGATTTVTIDRSVTTTSGTSYAMFSNWTLRKTISYVAGDTFKNIRLAKAATMIQVKVVMFTKGYYDEIQEILVDGNPQQKTT